MLNNFFYSHSIWTVALAVCFVTMVLPLIGLHFFHRWVDWNVREEDTSMVGLSYALCGGIFAVVLAFVAVGVYEQMERTNTTAAAEANSLGNLEFDTAGLPEDIAVRIRGEIDQYIDIVTEKEWPAQQNYQMDEKNFAPGWDKLRLINEEIGAFEPKTMGQTTVNGDMLRLINDLYNARRTRQLAASAHLPNAVWQMLIVGLLLVTAFIYLYGPHSFRIHMAVTGLTMLSIGLVFTLIIALDYPFRGALSVDDEAFKGVREVAHKTFEHAEMAPEAGKPPSGERTGGPAEKRE